MNPAGGADYQKDPARIARNTALLYFRQILVLLVSLYTSRIVLWELGAGDYGIYNVVGGFVSLFQVIAGAFSVAIARFLSYSLEQGDLGQLRRLYSAALAVQLVTGTVVCACLATFGSWYVTRVMVLPGERVGAALWVLGFSAVSFFINLLGLPCHALIVAHEHMRSFARIGIAEALCKLATALLLTRQSPDKLVYYSALTMLSAALTRLLYGGYCRRHFPECRFSWRFGKGTLREMLSFTSWAFLGNGAVVLRDQGLNLLLNQFGGPVVNAARGIAVNVNGAVTGFMNNYILAVQPQITKLCALGKREDMQELVAQSSRFAYYLLLLLCLPVMKNIHPILSLWLGEAPAHTAGFLVLLLADSLAASVNNPLIYGVLADGRIRDYEILLAAVYLSTLPLFYLSLSLSLAVELVYGILFLWDLLLMAILLWQSSRLYGLSVGRFLREVIGNLARVTALSAGVAALVHIPWGGVFGSLLAETALTVGATGGIILFAGMDAQERRMLLRLAAKKLKKKGS